MQTWFAHLSDPHLTTLEQVKPLQIVGKRLLGYISWRRKRRFEHRPEVLASLQQHLRQQTSNVQLLVTGDLTHIGLPDEFTQAANWLRQLGEPDAIAVIPGNHDACVALPWQRGLGQWQDYLNSDTPQQDTFPSLRVRGGIAFIGLSSACPKPPLMATGTVGARQLDKLAGLLQETREQGLFRVVYIHHPPKTGVVKWRKRLTDAPRLSALLQREGAELVLHGHGHKAQQYSLPGATGDIPVIATSSASAMGLHGADIAQYNRYGVESTSSGWNLTAVTNDYDPSADLFRAGAMHQWQLKRQ